MIASLLSLLWMPAGLASDGDTFAGLTVGSSFSEDGFAQVREHSLSPAPMIFVRARGVAPLSRWRGAFAGSVHARGGGVGTAEGRAGGEERWN